MRLSFAISVILILVVSASAYADFDYVGSIPAPQAPYGSSEVTGLSSAGGDLFAVVKADTSSFLFLISPDDGMVLRQAEFADEVPCGQGKPPQFMSGAAYDVNNDLYVVGDACGLFLEVVFRDAGSYVSDYYYVNDVETPTGLIFDDDTLYTVDWDNDVLVRAVGTVTDEYPLPGIDSPAGLTFYRNHLFVASLVRDNLIYEISRQAVLIDTHLAEGLMGCYPHAVTFHDGLLYVGSACGSILIFEPTTFNTDIPDGDSVVVEVVPDELDVEFDSVDTAGLFTVDVLDSQECPGPAGVSLYPPFYEMSTDVVFDYEVTIELTFTDSFLPAGYEVKNLRIFKRPSGPCQEYKDVTVNPVEIIPVLKHLMRTQSEDDEFSVFALGIDLRRPRAVVELKLADLYDVIVSNGSVIPAAVFDEITGMLDDAESAYYRGGSLTAEALVQDIADIVRGTPAIPHTFDGTPGSNVAGDIIARSHTLAFSLRYSESEHVETLAEIVPERIIVGLESPWITGYLEVPDGFDASQVDAFNIYLDGQVQAVPDSVLTVDYDSDGALEVRALFPRQAVEALLTESGPRTVGLTSFIDGYELRAEAVVDVFKPSVEIMGEDPLEGGRSYRVTWSAIFEEPTITYSMYCTLDGGVTWEEIVTGLANPSYYWQVPDVETDAGHLRVHVLDDGVEFFVFGSDIFSVVQVAGVIDGVGRHIDKLEIGPNPSSSSFRVRLAPSGDQPISVRVYSVTGDLVRTLVDKRIVDGVYSLTWDGDTEEGLPAAAGTYFVVLTDGHEKTVRKVVLQR